MPRFRPIDTDIWSSDTFLAYTSSQRDVFFFYHTSPSLTTSGIFRISLRRDALFFRHEDGSYWTPDELLRVIQSIPENLLLDLDESIIFAVKSLAHNGMKHGRPNLVISSILSDYRATFTSFLWEKFSFFYPNFASKLKDSCTSPLSDQANVLISDTPLQSLDLNFLQSLASNFLKSRLARKNYNIGKNLNRGVIGGIEFVKQLLDGISVIGDPFWSSLLTFITQQRNNVTSTLVTNPEPIFLLLDELAEMAKGDATVAMAILNHSSASSYKSLVMPQSLINHQQASQSPTQPQPNPINEALEISALRDTPFPEVINLFFAETYDPHIQKPSPSECLKKTSTFHFPLLQYIRLNTDPETLLQSLGLSQEHIHELMILAPTTTSETIVSVIRDNRKYQPEEILASLLQST